MSKNFEKEFEKQRKRFEKNLKRARGIAGNSAVRHFRDSFRNEGFTDESLEKWDPVKRAETGRTKAQRSRGILRKTGKLSKSIKVIESKEYKVVVGVEGITYAEVHNNGFRGIVNVRPHKRQNIIRAKVQGGFTGTANKRKTQTIELLGSRVNVKGYSYRQNIPQRQFIGNSFKLENTIQERLGEAWAQS